MFEGQYGGFSYMPIVSSIIDTEYRLSAIAQHIDDVFYTQIKIVINEQEAYVAIYGG